MVNKQEKKELKEIVMLRSIACLSVVMLHSILLIVGYDYQQEDLIGTVLIALAGFLILVLFFAGVLGSIPTVYILNKFKFGKYIAGNLKIPSTDKKIKTETKIVI